MKKTRLTAILVCFLLLAAAVLPAFADVSDDVLSAQKHNDAWGFPHREGVVLVLSGGGTKGLAHIGVFKVLEREHVPIAAIVGTSMGAIMGGLYASGWTADEMEEEITKVNLMEIISDRNSSSSTGNSDYSRPPKSGAATFNFHMNKNGSLKGKLGLLYAKDLYSFLSELTGRVTVSDFDQLPIPFVAMTTDLETGDSVALRNGNLASALRASMSIPGVFEPWELDGHWYVDGGLKANLPVIAAKKMFPGHPILAVNLSPKDITRSRETMHNMLEVGAQTLDILMVEQVRQNAAQADLEITPHVSDFNTLSESGYDVIVQRGVAAAEEKIDDIRALAKQCHEMYPASVHQPLPAPPVPTVADVRFEGIPASFAAKMRTKVDSWLGHPLDMQEVAKMVRQLSERDDFNTVSGRAVNLTKDTVAVVFTLDRPAKYEFGIGGYVDNMAEDSWLSLSAQVRDILTAGDVGSLEYRLGNRWGLMGTYFTPPADEHDSQLGLVLSARQEGLEPRDIGKYEFERYSARLAWYRSFSEKFRAGIGYAVEKVDYEDAETKNGPYLNVNFSDLDDPLLPTKGLTLTSDIWLPTDGTVVTSTNFTAYLPIWKNWKVILSGGLKTGDMANLPYAAVLGNNEELYSLAQHPFIGDQVYWFHLGGARTMLKSWWGGVNVELFGNYGQAMANWESLDEWWEVGLGLSIPTNNFAGKVVVVYDKDGEWTFGYSVGVPIWWTGPLP